MHLQDELVLCPANTRINMSEFVEDRIDRGDPNVKGERDSLNFDEAVIIRRVFRGHHTSRPERGGLPTVVGLVFACVAAVVVAAAPRNALAQATHDPEDAVYATGAVFETDEELAAKPRTPLYRNYLPPFVDLTDRFPKPRHQGEQSSCVGWAVGYAARSYYNSRPRGGPRMRADQIPSPAFIYDSIRRHGGSCDSGSRISDALDLLKKGAVPLADYPYDERLCRRPGAQWVARASKFRIADWRVVDTGRLDQVKAELAKSHPVVIGMRPNRGFHRLRGAKVWRAGMPVEDDGHHAVTVVGYSERGQYFVLMNSWGPGWGDGGFGRIDYDTFRKRVKRGFSMRIEAEPAPPKPGPVPPKPKPAPPSPVIPELRLPAIGCGQLAIEKRNERKFVVGFVGNRADLAKVRKAATQSKAGVEVELRPWPQCEALMTIEKPLAAPDRPSISLPKPMYRASETLAFDVLMGGFQGYLHVAYIQADGNVVNLVESDPLTLSTLAARARLTFGDGRDGRSKFTVTAPFGSEMIVALASRSPLFVEDRPLVETEREFLTALRRAIIARPDPAQPERVVAASFVVLQTTAGE